MESKEKARRLIREISLYSSYDARGIRNFLSPFSCLGDSMVGLSIVRAALSQRKLSWSVGITLRGACLIFQEV